jgi:hypothetical protein
MDVPMDVPCSTTSVAVDEPLIGSAPEAVSWVCLEQNGPWGAKAWTSSHLDPVLGASIETAAAEHRVRPSLIRRPGRHADPHTASARQVLVASSHPDRSWLLAGRLRAPESLLDLDWAAVAAGSMAEVSASLPGLEPAEPQLLVCTNGTRDTCCARLGRPVAAAAFARYPAQVWEVTHTSGHRFAPTSVLLPSGTLHGRVLDAAALLAGAVDGELLLAGLRGRSTWPAAGQAAEEHVRRTHAITGIDDLVVTAAGADWLVTHRDNRRWTVTVTSHESGERPESCGKDAKPITRYVATAVVADPSAG